MNVWDVSGRERPERAVRLSDVDLRTCWANLYGGEAAKAYRSVGLLAAAPRDAVPFLRTRVRPAAGLTPDAKKIVDRCLTELGHEKFKVRDRASATLSRLGEAALPALRQTLADDPPPEARRRLTILIQQLGQPAHNAEGRAALRALEVLEHAATTDARTFVKELAAGAPEAQLTLDAKASLERLAKRPAKP